MPLTTTLPQGPLPSRRSALQHGAVVAGLLACAGLPRMALAAFSKTAFDAKSVQAAVHATGGGLIAASADVLMTAPDIVENGAIVALSVSTALPDVRQMLILVEKNPAALAARFHVSDQIEANFSIRIKMAQSSSVYAVAVMSDGKALYAQQDIQVTVGGCDG